VAVRESVRRLRRLRRLAFVQVGASCLSRLSYLSYLKIFTKTTETTAGKCPRMSVLSGLCGGSARTKSGGLSPRLPRPLSTGPVAPARRRPCALAARTVREAASGRRTARTLQAALLGRGTSPTGCVCPWRRRPACGPEPTEISCRGSLWPAPRQRAVP